MRNVRFLNAERKVIGWDRDNGESVSGPYPMADASLSAELDAYMRAGGTVANYAAPPAMDTVDLMDMVQLRIMFNHENRIRALEGKAAITIAQFKTAIRTLLT